MPDTDPVTIRLAEIRERHQRGDPGNVSLAIGSVQDVPVLLAAVETALRIHSPRREHWCEECTPLHPCTPRREITAVLLGETADG